jgi:hypothetical protein
MSSLLDSGHERSKTAPRRSRAFFVLAIFCVRSPVHLGNGVPKLANLMDEAEADVLAYMTFPKEHRAKRHSTNPIERLNGEIKRRTEVVGIFPNEEATHMLDNGADIRFIQALLGHVALSSTERCTHGAIRKLQEVHAATHPARLAWPTARKNLSPEKLAARCCTPWKCRWRKRMTRIGGLADQKMAVAFDG